jgi:hypothetical protein
MRPPLRSARAGGRVLPVRSQPSATQEPPQFAPSMRLIKFIALTALVAVSVAGGIAGALRLTRPKPGSAAALHTPVFASIDSTPAYPLHAAQSISALSASGLQTNILELPKASSDFEGYWGGYMHSSIRRFSPDLIGASPDRVSVVFGRRRDAIFMASELYTSPSQKIVRRPKARMVGARTAIIEYQSADNDLQYICNHRFQLKDAATITYRSTVEVYDSSSHALIGVVIGHATLKRLRTPREQLEFARPSRLEVPRAEISAVAASPRSD